MSNIEIDNETIFQLVLRQLKAIVGIKTTVGHLQTLLEKHISDSEVKISANQEITFADKSNIVTEEQEIKLSRRDKMILELVKKEAKSHIDVLFERVGGTYGKTTTVVTIPEDTMTFGALISGIILEEMFRGTNFVLHGVELTIRELGDNSIVISAAKTEVLRNNLVESLIYAYGKCKNLDIEAGDDFRSKVVKKKEFVSVLTPGIEFGVQEPVKNVLQFMAWVRGLRNLK